MTNRAKSLRLEMPMKGCSSVCIEVPDWNFSISVLPSVMDSTSRCDSIEDTIVCDLPKIKDRELLEEMKRKIIYNKFLN